MPSVNAKGKYQPWYHESFISDPRVRKMNSLARKTYMTLLHEAFVCSTRPYLPDDEEELELLSDCTDTEEWASVRGTVLGMFQRGMCEDRPVLINKRLVEDWNDLLDIREKRSEAGKASGEARRAKSSKTEHVFNVPEHRSFVPNKEVRKEVNKEREVSEEPQDENKLLEEDTDMKSEREIQNISLRVFGKTATFYGSAKSTLLALERSYKGSAVVRAFEDWALGLDEAPNSPGMAFLAVAEGLLGGETVSQQAAKAPEVISLVRELTYASDGKVKFADRQKPLLAELAAEYSQSEILGVFKTWLEDQDLTDPRKLDFASKNFVECADALCYSARRKKQEKSAEEDQREITKARLQAEADAERQAVEAEKNSEELLDNPLEM